MAVVAYHILKEAKKIIRNSFLHINTQVLTNRINKMVEFNALELVIQLLIRRTDSLLEVAFVDHCNITVPWDTEERKLS